MTVKELNDTLKEMRSIYPFDENNSIVYAGDIVSHEMNRISVHTVDKKTGIIIHMEKVAEVKEDERNSVHI